MLALLKKLWHVVCYITNQFLDDNCSGTAASLSYSTLLSIVPLVLMTISIASTVPAFEGVVKNIQHFVLQNFVAGVAGSISKYLDEFIKQINRLSWTNIVAFVVTALLLLYNMVHAFNLVWGVKMDWHRRFTIRFLFYFGILLITPIMLAILMMLISYVMSLSFTSNQNFHELVAYPFLIALPYIAAFVTFTFFNWVLPTCKVKLRYSCVAGLVTACFFEVLKYLFTLYIQIFPTYRLIYGALAAIPIFMLWIYLTWTLILIGAILCKGLQDRFNSQQSHVPSL